MGEREAAMPMAEAIRRGMADCSPAATLTGSMPPRLH